jgi:polysaccharide pyruvyl transferase WcaK-like protein
MNFANLTPGGADVAALRDAAFIFTRDTLSLKVLANQDPDGPDGTMRDLPSTPIDETINRVATGFDFSDKHPSFVPDTAFAFPSRNEAAARAFMAQHGLEPGRFACFVPRHRWTPTGRPTPKGDSREAYNANFQPQDIAKMLTTLGDYVTRTGNRAALVPETVYALPLLKTMRDQLSPAIAGRTAILETFWLPDMAASLFGHAQVVVSMENHSPIIAATVGTPFVMLHQPEDTIKSQMFSDIGLDDWYIHDIGAVTGSDISRIVMRIVSSEGRARARLAKVMRNIAERQGVCMQAVRAALRDAMRAPTDMAG